MTINNEQIKNILSEISDPDIGKTLGELNAIKSINIDDSSINIYLSLIQPIHLVSIKLKEIIEVALKKDFPNFKINIEFEEISVPNRSKVVLSKVKNIIAVASGKGGVGKSTLASNIAATLSLTGARVGILDSDVYGPSQPTMFGLEGSKLQAYELEAGKTVAYPIDKYGIKVASMGFLLNRSDAAIIRGPMLAGYFSMLFEQVEWGELDYLVFDLPPGTGDIQLTLTQKIPLTGAVIVTTPQEISLSDVRRSISMFRKVNVDVIGIIENMSYFIPPDMPDKKYYIFGEGGGRTMADEFGVPLLGEVPINTDMRVATDVGKPIVLTDASPLQTEVLKQITANIISGIRKLNAQSAIAPEMEISI